MLSDPMLFAFCLVDTGALLFLLVYFVMTLSDLECDYLNAQECCSRLNVWVIPKLCVHGILVFFLFITGHWLLTIANLPIILWLAHEFKSVSGGSLGVYDPTEIHNRGQLKIFMRNILIHVGFYLIIFFVYLYCLILSCLKHNPLEGMDKILTQSDFAQ